MSDHVMKALEDMLRNDMYEHVPKDMRVELVTDMAPKCAKQFAVFLRSLIEQGPDEEMKKQRLAHSSWNPFSQEEEWSWQCRGPELMQHLATRLEAIALKEKG